jgi:hypothetical protein
MIMILRKSARTAMAIGLVAALFVLFAAPYAIAQSQDDLRGTIRAQLLSDPRTANLSEAELNAMVELLASEAEAQDISSADITWRPQVEEPVAEAPVVAYDYCGATPHFLCAFNIAFGFAGTDPTMPFVLGAAAMGLVWVLAEILHRHKKHFVHGPSSGPSSGSSSGLYA